MGHHDFFSILIVAYVAVIVFIRTRRLKSLRSLSNEDKLKLFDVRISNWQYFVYLLILFGGITLFHYKRISVIKSLSGTSILTLYAVWYVALLATILYLQFSRYKKLKRAGLPDDYTKSCLINNIVTFLAILGFVVAISYNTYHLYHIHH